ncbi:MAG TPA: pantoate--beta-alanine ligase [Isoptericola sp.]|nr:pantoate--beta-alanine ligase [Isoptericola sp.]
MTTTPHAPAVVSTRADLHDALGSWTLSGPEPTDRRAVVMTMGALHEGHLELVRQAREAAGPTGQVIVTIFVNPLQFGAGEDLDRYPRDLDGDVAKLASVGADVVFAPTPDVVYPDGDPIVRVSAGRIGEVLEGESRPGHLDGVLTVVLKLMHLTRPDVALFGEKDAQQLLAVRRMVRDLDVDVEVLGVPIVRDADGLALSSRNAYLSDDERASALALSRALRAGADAAAEGPEAVVAAASGILDGAVGVEVDYLALVDPTTVDPVPADFRGPALLLVAARTGATRLIDNQAVDLAGSAATGPATGEDSQENASD